MTATLQVIERWLQSAKEKGASHLIIAVDTYDYENYPVYVGYNEDVNEEIERVQSQSMQGIDEVYNMQMDINEQLNQQKVWNV